MTYCLVFKMFSKLFSRMCVKFALYKIDYLLVFKDIKKAISCQYKYLTVMCENKFFNMWLTRKTILKVIKVAKGACYCQTTAKASSPNNTTFILNFKLFTLIRSLVVKRFAFNASTSG